MSARALAYIRALASSSDFQECMKEVCDDQVRQRVDSIRTHVRSGHTDLASKAEAEAGVFEDLIGILQGYKSRKGYSS